MSFSSRRSEKILFEAYTMGDGVNEIFSCICAYFLPPLGIWWRFGCGINFLICLVLTLCGYVPGVLYAVVMIGCDEPSRFETAAREHLFDEEEKGEDKL